MEEKKLTDEEIFKALKCCYDSEIICPNKCPLKEDEKCAVTLHKNIMFFIQRLQAENKNLKSASRNKTNNIYELLDKKKELEKQLKTVRKETAEKFAEIADDKSVYFNIDGTIYKAVHFEDIAEICKGIVEGK